MKRDERGWQSLAPISGFEMATSRLAEYCDNAVVPIAAGTHRAVCIGDVDAVVLQLHRSIAMRLVMSQCGRVPKA
jgi:hypothetical protein